LLSDFLKEVRADTEAFELDTERRDDDKSAITIKVTFVLPRTAKRETEEETEPLLE